MKSNDPMLLLDMPPVELALYFEEKEHTLEIEHLKQLYRDLSQLEADRRKFLETNTHHNQFIDAEKQLIHDCINKLNLIDITITRLQNKEKIRNETAHYTTRCLLNLKNKLSNDKLNALSIHDPLQQLIKLLSNPEVSLNAISTFCDNIKTTDFLIHELLKLDIIEKIIARSWENDALQISHIIEHISNRVDYLLCPTQPTVSTHLQNGIDICNQYLAGRMAYPWTFKRSVSQCAYFKAIQSAFCTVRHGYRAIEFLHASPKDDDIKQANTIYLYTRYECANGPENYCAIKDNTGEITYFELTHDILGDASASVHAAISYHHEMSPALENTIINAINTVKGYRYQLKPEERENFLNTAYSKKQKQPTPIVEAVFRPAFQQAAHYVAQTHKILNIVHNIPEIQPLLKNTQLTLQEKLQAIFAENPFKRKQSFFERLYFNVSHWFKKLWGKFLYQAIPTEEKTTHQQQWQIAQQKYMTLEHNMEALLTSSTAVDVPLLKPQITHQLKNTFHPTKIEQHEKIQTLTPSNTRVRFSYLQQ